MLIDQINLNQLRVFESVFRTKSMTHAAKELHLTQSGVSQHVKSLEDILEIKLFDRIKQKLIPTPAAKELYRHTAKSFEEIETALMRLKKTDEELSGLVRIGVPIQFGNNVLIPLIAEFQKKFPRIQFYLKQGFTHDMGKALLADELDFAFVDGFHIEKGIVTEEVYNEVLELCYSENLAIKPSDDAGLDELRDFPYVDYEQEQSILKSWFKHHFGARHPEVETRLFILDAQAIAKTIELGVGIGVIPGHLFEKMIRQGVPLTAIKGSGKPLLNRISVAAVEDKTLSSVALSVLNHLKQRLSEPERARA